MTDNQLLLHQTTAQSIVDALFYYCSCPHEGCTAAFAFPNLLKRHMKVHQGYSCNQCDWEFEKWTELRKHMSTEHKTGKYLTIILYYNFYYLSLSFISSLLVHACSICAKTFKRPCDVRRHELTHSGKKEMFNCPEDGCHKAYDRVSTLRKHIKAQHHGELPFRCHLCVAAFPYKVRRHIVSPTSLLFIVVYLPISHI